MQNAAKTAILNPRCCRSSGRRLSLAPERGDRMEYLVILVIILVLIERILENKKK